MRTIMTDDQMKAELTYDILLARAANGTRRALVRWLPKEGPLFNWSGLLPYLFVIEFLSLVAPLGLFIYLLTVLTNGPNPHGSKTLQHGVTHYAQSLH